MKIADIRAENRDIRYECDEIICHVLNTDRAGLLMRLYTELEDDRYECIMHGLTCLKSGEPLQYILKKAPFFNRDFYVEDGVLIPRYDTECLVELSLDVLKNKSTFADVCCGSGCIGITLLCENDGLFGTLLDISPKALKVSGINSERFGVEKRCSISHFDVMKKAFWDTLGKFDVILSNPPYIPSGDIPTLSKTVLREPIIALDGGEDGMDFYKKIIEYSTGHFNDKVNIIFEIGYDEGEKMRALASSFGLLCEIRRDMNGCDRVALLNER